MQSVKQSTLNNEAVRTREILKCMYQDSYFPTFLVDKCKNILLRLCHAIEEQKPKTLEDLYKLTHSSTDELNDLQIEFEANESEIETAARECLGLEFQFIAISYGFEADTEELIGTREW